MYKHNLKVYGDYLAKEQALPQNTSANGNGNEVRLGGTMGGIEIVLECIALITLADTKVLTIKLRDSADGTTYADLETVYTVTASGETTVAAGTIMARFILPTDCNDYIMATLTSTDAALTGSVSIYPTYLPR